MKTLRALAELIGLWILITAALAACALALNAIDPLRTEQPTTNTRGAV